MIRLMEVPGGSSGIRSPADRERYVRFNSTSDGPPYGNHTITSFDRGQGDRIDPKAIDANRSGPLGNRDFKLSQLIHEKDNGNGFLTVNVYDAMTFR